MQKMIGKFMQSILGKIERRREGLSSTGREGNICDNPCSSSCSEIDYVTGSCMHAVCINLSFLATMHVSLPHDKASHMLRRISFFKPQQSCNFYSMLSFWQILAIPQRFSHETGSTMHKAAQSKEQFCNGRSEWSNAHFWGQHKVLVHSFHDILQAATPASRII